MSPDGEPQDAADLETVLQRYGAAMLAVQHFEHHLARAWLWNGSAGAPDIDELEELRAWFTHLASSLQAAIAGGAPAARRLQRARL